MRLIFSGIAVHLLFLASIFDIYFNSPVLHGIQEFQPFFEPAAERLVLFVADGLRANSFFSSSNHSPYLHSVILNRGSWGVSHTRVPTESRPGHVAMIAGLYEDPSAVTKGWKENPVEFDSVFNRSSHTWAWGSADILPMFAKGEASGRVTTYTYPKSMQTFSGDGSNEKLDSWVFERVQRFFKATAFGNDKVKKQGTVFFLHLLGIDTAGHATKPHSKEYLDNIKLVDDGVERMEEVIEEFFDYDGKTVYLFTSDHGMTDWGSHGAGLPDETETPIIVWGSGIKGPERVAQNHISPDHWGLKNLERKDVEQADIAALMSALLAIPTPTNNVGILPTKYINKNQEWITDALLSNAHQIVLQLERAKMLVHEKLFGLFLVPYSKLNIIEEWKTKAANKLFNFHLVEETDQIFEIALQGLEYYQNYFGSSLKMAITYSHFLWMFFLITRLICKKRLSPRNYSFVLFDVFTSISILATLILIIAQDLPLQYILFYSLPSVLLWAICRDLDLWWPQVAPMLRKYFVNLLLIAFAVGLGIGCLVTSFFERSVLSIDLLVIALWPAIHKTKGSCLHWGIIIAWTTASTALALFPLLPVIGKEANYWLVFLGGACIFTVGSVYTIWLHSESKKLLLSQSVLVLVSSLNVLWTTHNFDTGQGLTMINQIISWSVVAFSLIAPVVARPSFGCKMLSLSFSTSAIFVLLSVRHEVFFLFFLLVLLNLYPTVEMQVSTKLDFIELSAQILSPKVDKLSNVILADLRRAYFYLFFTILAFYGTGNIASLNSFDPAWVRTFVTTFAPHLMGALILVKTVLPFFAVACSIAIVSMLSKRPIQWLLVLAISDIMALPFFHLVRTKGSWLDIGQSISHFVIAHVCILFLLLLHWGAQELLVLRLPGRLHSRRHKRDC